MQKVILLLALPIAVSCLNGCAKSSDVDALEARVTVLEEKMSTLAVDVAAVKEAAADAAVKAVAAEAAANRAAAFAEDTNTKLNVIIKRNCGADC
ncbi:Lpp/OprI family alanine-zipper lipoprotein [Methylomonas sp. AM2-LC]|uniref:Lpp/OprI family alanine-zipper lipoprotein n=1 Tax=Methylomonas sp. AM2-LC TaxID=3153301 RepID=UPI00326685DD